MKPGYFIGGIATIVGLVVVAIMLNPISLDERTALPKPVVEPQMPSSAESSGAPMSATTPKPASPVRVGARPSNPDLPSLDGGATMAEVVKAEWAREQARYAEYIAAGLQLWSTERLASAMKPFCTAKNCKADVLSLLAGSVEEEAWLLERGYPSPGEYVAIRTEPLEIVRQRNLASPGAKAALARRELEEFYINGRKHEPNPTKADYEVFSAAVNDGSVFAWMEYVRSKRVRLMIGRSVSPHLDVAGYRIAAMAGETWARALQDEVLLGPSRFSGFPVSPFNMANQPRGSLDDIDRLTTNLLSEMRNLQMSGLLLTAGDRPGGQRGSLPFPPGP